MRHNLRLRSKFLLAFLFLGITPLVIVGYITFNHSSMALSEAAFAQLESIREVKKAQILHLFETHQRNLEVLLETVRTLRQEALEKFQSVQESQLARIEEYFHTSSQQLTVFAANQTVMTALMQFGTAIGTDGTIDEGRYAYFESEFGPSLRRFNETFGFADLMLINQIGTVVYTINKDSDLGQNIITGQLKDSGLGKRFAQMLERLTIQDFEPYPPSQNQQIGFIGAPIVVDGETIGAIVLKLLPAVINRIVQTREGMGTTGETFIVRKTGQAVEYRSDRIVQQGRIGETASTLNPELISSGTAGSLIEIGSSGQIELLRYAPLNLPDLNWVIITTMLLEEVLSPKLDGETDDYFTRYLKKYGYDDLFLIHPNGHIFYTVKHEADYKTSLVNGQYSATGLGKLFNHVMQTGTFGLADFEAYGPSNNQPAGFMAQPLLVDNAVELVVALQIPIDGINAVMLERTGMRTTGETYLVGADGLLRSDSFLEPVNHSVAASLQHPEQGTIQTSASQQALAGQTGRGIVRNYLDRQVLSAYTPVQIGDITWALIAEIDTAEALAAVKRLTTSFGVVIGISLIAIVIVAVLWSNYITRPINQFLRIGKAIAGGDLEQKIMLRQSDEIGALADAFREMQTTIASVMRELRLLIQNVQAGNLSGRGKTEKITGGWRELVVGINQVLDAFAVPITQIDHALVRVAQGDLTETLPTNYQGDFAAMIQQVQMMTDQLTDVVRKVKAAAQDVAQRSKEMNTVAEQMSEGASQQAASTEEISASIEEMAANIRQSADNAKLAESMALKSVEDARAGNHAVMEFIRAMDTIANRVSIIQEIASQTNMLSLNATIEAAKAQEYGKGFSVVASSVRELARQSRAAADEIYALVHSCVALSAQAGDVLQQLVPNSEKTAELVQEISASSHEQFHGVNQINQAMQQLDSITQHTAVTAEQVASTAESLTRQAETLENAMAFFTVNEAIPIAVQTGDKWQRFLDFLADAPADMQMRLLTTFESAVSKNAPQANSSRRMPHSHITPHPATDRAHEHSAQSMGDELDQDFERY